MLPQMGATVAMACLRLFPSLDQCVQRAKQKMVEMDNKVHDVIDLDDKVVLYGIAMSKKGTFDDFDRGCAVVQLMNTYNQSHQWDIADMLGCDALSCAAYYDVTIALMEDRPVHRTIHNINEIVTYWRAFGATDFSNVAEVVHDWSAKNVMQWPASSSCVDLPDDM
jgi:hypothetical protein